MIAPGQGLPPERPVGRWAIASACATLVMAAACVVFAFMGFCIGARGCHDVPRIITTMTLITELATLAGLITTAALAIWAYRVRHHCTLGSTSWRWARQSAVVTLALLTAAGAVELVWPGNSIVVVLFYGFLVGLPTTIVPAIWALARRR